MMRGEQFLRALVLERMRDEREAEARAERARAGRAAERQRLGLSDTVFRFLNRHPAGFRPLGPKGGRS